MTNVLHSLFQMSLCITNSQCTFTVDSVPHVLKHPQPRSCLLGLWTTCEYIFMNVLQLKSQLGCIDKKTQNFCAMKQQNWLRQNPLVFSCSIKKIVNRDHVTNFSAMSRRDQVNFNETMSAFVLDQEA